MKPVPMLATARRAAGDDAGDPGVLLHQPRRLGHLLEGRRHLDVVLVEDVLAVGEDVALLENRNRVDRAFADAAAGLAVPAVGRDQRRIEVIELVPALVGQLRIVEEVVERQDPAGGHVLPVADRTGHDDREFPALLGEIGDQLGEVFRLGQDQVLDVDACQLAELGDERQQQFGERVLVQADGERLALCLLPVDLGLAVVGQRLVVLRLQRGLPRWRASQGAVLRAVGAASALVPPILSCLFCAQFSARGRYPVKQNRIPLFGMAN